MSDIIGSFKKVSEKNGEITAMFSYSKEFHNGLYLYLEKQSEVGYSELKKRLAIYENYINFQTRVVITVDDTNTKTSTGINKVLVKSVKEYKKPETSTISNLDIKEDKLQRLSEEMRHNVVLSTQARIYASKLALELEKLEEEEKEYFCILLQCSPKYANYCREDLGGKKNYYLSINYEKEEIKKFQSSTKDDLFFQVIQFAKELERRRNE